MAAARRWLPPFPSASATPSPRPPRLLVLLLALAAVGSLAAGAREIRVTEKAQAVLEDAQRLALEQGHAATAPEHLAHALFREGGPSDLGPRILRQLTGDAPALRRSLQRLAEAFPSQKPRPREAPWSREMGEALQAAESWKEERGDSFVAVPHLILGAVAASKRVKEALSSQGVPKDLAALKELLERRMGRRPIESATVENTFDALEKYATDLVALAEAGKLDPVVGRDEETRRVIQVLSRKKKNNPVLVGEPGVGKTAIAEGLALRIMRGDVPKALVGAKLYALDLAAIVAGSKMRGEFEERLQAVLKEVSEAKGRVLLFIDEMHTLFGAGAAGGSMDAANMLKPMLARGELRCIGATTLDEYQKHVERDAAFERRLSPVYVNEPDVESTISILRGLKEHYEGHHGVRILDAGVVAAAQLAARYLTGRRMPDKAIDLLDEACAEVRVQLDSLPPELDAANRKVLRLEAERAALSKEASGDPQEARRLEAVTRDLAALQERQAELEAELAASRDLVQRIRDAKRDIEEVEWAIDFNERKYNVDKVSQLRYEALPPLQQQLSALEERARNSSVASTDVVGPEQVAQVVARWTGIPTQKLSSSESEKLLALADNLRRRVMGQDPAVEAVAAAILRSRAGLASPRRPVGSFLFLGSSGVGKTELARALAHELFDDERHLVRVDMAEFSEPHSVARLIGAPPGYVGHDEGGQLTEPVKRRPYCVVLFDEVEKAHPQVWKTLLQVLDDGRLTDARGRTVDFTNTVVILTSNLGTQALLRAVAEGPDTDGATWSRAVQEVHKQVWKHFVPEFLNRLDEIVVFKPLSRELLRAVLDLQVEQLLAPFVKEHGVTVHLEDSVAEWLLKDGYDAAEGARRLRRAVERNLLTPLARERVRGNVPDGATVTATWKDGRLGLRADPPATPALATAV